MLTTAAALGAAVVHDAGLPVHEPTVGDHLRLRGELAPLPDVDDTLLLTVPDLARTVYVHSTEGLPTDGVWVVAGTVAGLWTDAAGSYLLIEADGVTEPLLLR